MTCYVFIPGSGGGAPDLSGLKTGPDDHTWFIPITYPGWRRYVAPDFTPALLMAELAAEIAARVPSGPIRIIGLSMGGHFGYLAALQLQAQGRKVEGLCAIDSFMVVTASATPGWKGRAASEALELVVQGRIGELLLLARSKFWRAVLRGLGNRLPGFLRNASRIDWLCKALELDPILKLELDIRMLAREVAPFLARIDDQPVTLSAPMAFLRTKLNADNDTFWRARCPNFTPYDIIGGHHTLFEPENIGSLRDAFVKATRSWG
jgi:thioesterase domain-containing protein